MSYSCIIIDDNEIERDLLEVYLGKIGNLSIKAICANAFEALKILAKEQIDIVFSDIDMPDVSGIELLKTIKNPPIFIFVTSFPEYAIESINLDALDFIVKPLSIERLIKASEKAIEYLDLKKTSNHAEYNLDKKDENFFFIKDTKGYIRINYSEVLYIESLADFSRFHMLNARQHMALVNLKNIEKQLSQSIFMRVHRQFIINLDFLSEIIGNEIVLENGIKIPMGIAYKDNLIDLIHKKTLSRYSKS